ncbi:CD180 antigen [Ambystoma mexicanum]|uniref:CD180 antigen n=1 Tax=Ambystoma mexicanum TaxID=8296 RepID=UPI0037E7A33B
MCHKRHSRIFGTATHNFSSMAPCKDVLLLVVAGVLAVVASGQQAVPADKQCTKIIDDESYTCADLGLNVIPESLPPSLKNLDFSFNILFAIYPSTFSRLQNLWQLDLTRCSVSWIYDNAFQNNPDLDTLLLIGNPLMYVADTAFDGPVSLRHLFLTQTCLNHLAFIARHNLDNLETFHLGNNHLTSINLPDSFHAKSLKYLDLQLNNIHAISANDVAILSKATNLSLNLKGNYIKYIEPSSFNSHFFNILDIAGCASSIDISVILEGLMGVSAHILRLGTFNNVPNNIGMTSHSLQALCNVSTMDLNLQNMYFTDLSNNTFHCLATIKKLDLTHTGLSILPPDIRNDSLMTELTLNKNKFENVCDIRLASFPLLTRLSIKGNTEILQLGSSCFEKLSKLQHLDLSLSGIFTSDCCGAQLKGLISLKNLNLSYNNDHTLQDLAFPENGNLELLDFTHTHLHINGSERPFRNLGSLRVLNLSSSQIETSHCDLLTGLKSLVLLNLNGNVFHSGVIQKDNLFQQAPNLETLILSACELIAIDNEAFQALTKLQYVYLNHNKLTVFSSNVFWDLSQILLNFAENDIKIIPQEMLDGISGHSIINLSYNPLDCTCANIAFVMWLRQNKDKVESLEETTCGSPVALSGRRLDMVALSCRVSVVDIVLIVLLVLLVTALCALIVRYVCNRRYQYI